MTNGRLAGKTALVTGGAGGIGRAIVERFCAEGASVLIADIDEAQTQATAAAIARRGGTVIGHQADVADPEQAAAAVARAVEEFGTLQVLVNNAAHFGPHATVEDMLLENWARTLAVNLTGPFLMSKYAIPALRQAGGGSIIHIASQLGSVGRAQRSDYCSTKGALLQLARCMAADHAADHIRVNTLSPGPTITQRMIAAHGSEAAAQQSSGARTLLKRLGRPEEIAAAAVFLASDESTFMTGDDLLMDGGYNAI